MSCDLCGLDNCTCELTLSYDRRMREKENIAKLQQRIKELEEYIEELENEIKGYIGQYDSSDQ